MIDMAEYALHFYVKKGESFWSSVTFKTPASARKRAYTLLSVMPRGAYARIYDYSTDRFTEALDVTEQGKFRASDENNIWFVNPKTGGIIR